MDEVKVGDDKIKVVSSRKGIRWRVSEGYENDDLKVQTED